MHTNRLNWNLGFVVLWVGLAGLVCRSAGAVSFMGLGDLPGGTVVSTAWDISADGSTVVGVSQSGLGRQAFRWTASSGMVGLGDLPGGHFSSDARGVSADGSVVAGLGTTEAGIEAYVWKLGGEMVGIGDLRMTGTTDSRAFDVSDDGLVVVGRGRSTEAFRWTEAGGMKGLGDLPGKGFLSNGLGVSSDGSVIVGWSPSEHGFEAFRWTEDGMVGLGDLPGGGFNSLASNVSADGSVVVGRGRNSVGDEAFRWTAEDGMVGLGGSDTSARDVSADGSVIVGIRNLEGTSQGPFIWDEENKMRDLEDVLMAGGVDLTGWRLIDAEGISADGMVIVGNGVNPMGRPEGWVADLRVPVPEPMTGWLGLMGVCGVMLRIRRGAHGGA